MSTLQSLGWSEAVESATPRGRSRRTRSESRPLRGRFALVTGAARGVGRGIALCLGEAGATVYLTDRASHLSNEHTPGPFVEDTADQVSARGGMGIPARVDPTDDSQLEALFAGIATESGGLDIVVFNVHAQSGVPREHGPFWTLPPSLWDDLFIAGVRSQLVTARLALPLVFGREGALLVFTSTLDPDAPVLAENAYYDLAMATINRFVRALGHELADQGITVLGLCPGTPSPAEVLDPRHPPHGESIEYTGRAVVALACDEHVQRKTGRVLRVSDLATEYDFTDLDGTRPAPSAFTTTR
ncbi:MAG: SDR family NAD(P)-dependent oxidoreductase [Pseudomonadota bacterium]